MREGKANLSKERGSTNSRNNFFQKTKQTFKQYLNVWKSDGFRPQKLAFLL